MASSILKCLVTNDSIERLRNGNYPPITFARGRVISVSRLIVVSAVVNIAVKKEHIQIPVRIQTTANKLPEIDFKQRSP